MSHLVAQMTSCIEWYKIETDMGIWYVDVTTPTMSRQEILDAWDNEDADVIEHMLQYTEGTDIIDDITIIKGYGVRLSAPGYIDCTDWDVYLTEEEALDAYNELKEELEEEDKE